jgi:HAD superfamily hydrolase (TIGR01484 family)
LSSSLDGFRPAAVLLDLDGTLLDERDRISSRTVAAVRAAARRVPVAVASGRVLEDVTHFARLLGLDGPQVCDNGARLAHALTGRTVADLPIEVEVAQRIVERLEGAERRYFAVDSGRTVRRIADFAGWRVTVITCGLQTREDAEALAQLDHGNGVSAIPSMGSRGEWYINYTHALVNKGYGVRVFCDHTGVRPEDVMAVGDGLNDLDMFDAVGLPVAMGHATPAARERAKAVTGALDEDGVAQAMERWVL